MQLSLQAKAAFKYTLRKKTESVAIYDMMNDKRRIISFQFIDYQRIDFQNSVHHLMLVKCLWGKNTNIITLTLRE